MKFIILFILLFQTVITSSQKTQSNFEFTRGKNSIGRNNDTLFIKNIKENKYVFTYNLLENHPDINGEVKRNLFKYDLRNFPYEKLNEEAKSKIRSKSDVSRIFISSDLSRIYSIKNELYLNILPPPFSFKNELHLNNEEPKLSFKNDHVIICHKTIFVMKDRSSIRKSTFEIITLDQEKFTCVDYTNTNSYYDFFENPTSKYLIIYDGDVKIYNLNNEQLIFKKSIPKPYKFKTILPNEEMIVMIPILNLSPFPKNPNALVPIGNTELRLYKWDLNIKDKEDTQKEIIIFDTKNKLKYYRKYQVKEILNIHKVTSDAIFFKDGKVDKIEELFQREKYED